VEFHVAERSVDCVDPEVIEAIESQSGVRVETTETTTRVGGSESAAEEAPAAEDAPEEAETETPAE
jgi:hypothetical protein